MRDQDTLRDPKPEKAPPVITVTKRSKFIAANILDPVDGSVQFHIVSTKWFNILAVVVITLFLCGLTVLGLLLYVKSSVDENSQQIQELQQAEAQEDSKEAK